MKLLHLGVARMTMAGRVGSFSEDNSTAYCCPVSRSSCARKRPGSACPADAVQGIRPVPPYGIMEPTLTYEDGSPREDGALHVMTQLQLSYPIVTLQTDRRGLLVVMQMNQQLDMLVMPGLGFDSSGGRLGRGGGYYDKFLTRCFARAREKGWIPPLLGMPCSTLVYEAALGHDCI